MKRVLKIVGWTVGVIIALVLVVSIVAGPVVKGYINSHGEELVGRKVGVAHVGINLFSGRVNVRDLAVYEEDGEAVFAGFDTLDVSARLLALPFKTLHFGHITLVGLHARVAQEGDHFNFSSMLEHFSSGDTTPKQDTTPSGWLMKFYNIRLSHAKLHYEDVGKGKGLNLADINLRVPGFIIGDEADSQGGLNIGFDKGGHLNVEAGYDAMKHTYEVDLRLSDFNVANIEAYLADVLVCESLDGKVDARLTAKGSVDDVLKSRIGGRVAIRDFDVEGEWGSVASFDSLAVGISNINLEDNEFELSEVLLGGFAAQYEQWKEYSNIGRLLPPQQAEADTAQVVDDKHMAQAEVETKEEAKPLRLKVGQLRITDAALTYTDHTLPDEFYFPITALSFSADNLTTAGGNNARLRATLPGGGHVALRWEGCLDDWKKQQALFLTIKGLDMRQLSPWAVAYTGQPIEEGIFGLTTRLNIANSLLDNQNKIDIYKARVGSRRKDVEPEMKIPLKAALYVLKDKDEKILIELPIKGDVDSPEFNYMKLVWKTLGNLLVKVATSPARALAGAMGIGGGDMDFMAVDVRQHSLTSEQYHTLGNIAKVAMADSLVCFELQQQMPAAEDDSVRMHYQRFNRMVETYLHEQGMSQAQLRITTAEVAAGERTGYAIESKLNIED